MKKAWVENNVVREVCAGDPAQMYHPEIAALFNIEVPDDIQVGATLVDDVWTNVAASEVVIGNKVSPVEFKLLFTAQERVTIKQARATDAIIDDFYDIVEDPRLTHVDLGLQSTKDALAYLVFKELLTQARASEILAGQVK